MLRDFIDSASSQPRALSRISLDDAYERLGMSSDADDDLAISAYESAVRGSSASTTLDAQRPSQVEDRPKNRDIYYEALGTISEHRQSRQIGFFLEHKRRSVYCCLTPDALLIGSAGTDAEMAVVLAASVSPDLPAGLNNIGKCVTRLWSYFTTLTMRISTCYLKCGRRNAAFCLADLVRQLSAAIPILSPAT